MQIPHLFKTMRLEGTCTLAHSPICILFSLNYGQKNIANSFLPVQHNVCILHNKLVLL